MAMGPYIASISKPGIPFMASLSNQQPAALRRAQGERKK